MLYLIIGYMMGQHLTWEQLVLMYMIMLVIQMITRVKAIADGILMIQSLNERYDRHRDRIGEMDEILDEMRERVDKEDLN